MIHAAWLQDFARNEWDMDIPLEAPLLEQTGIDSLDIITLVMAIEEHLHVTVSREIVGKLHTLGDIARYMAEVCSE